MNESNLYGVEIRLMSEVRSLKSVGKTFVIELSDFAHLTSDFVCIACGGYPKLSMFQWLKDLGHSISEPVPSLFTFNLPKHPIIELMGVSVENVRVKIEGSKLVEPAGRVARGIGAPHQADRRGHRGDGRVQQRRVEARPQRPGKRPRLRPPR